MRVLFLTLFLTVYSLGFGQVDSFQENIIECLTINGTPEEYSFEYDETMDVLYQQFKSSNAPEKFWAELKSDKEEKIEELLSMLAFAYRKHFTKEDVESITAFYKTETAQFMLKDYSALTEEQKCEIGDFESSETGQKINQVQNKLSADMAEIVRDWKTELFSEKMKKLIKNNYRPKW